MTFFDFALSYAVIGALVGAVAGTDWWQRHVMHCDARSLSLFGRVAMTFIVGMLWWPFVLLLALAAQVPDDA